MLVDDMQEALDAFYSQRGPCCAGCDWWRAHNSIAGDCTKSAPVDGRSRWAILGIHGVSTFDLPTGHIVTPRDHVCGAFKDDFDWSSLPLPYLARIGRGRAR